MSELTPGAAANLAGLRSPGDAGVALWTVGVFAALYAGVLDPSVRVSESQFRRAAPWSGWSAAGWPAPCWPRHC